MKRSRRIRRPEPEKIAVVRRLGRWGRVHPVRPRARRRRGGREGFTLLEVMVALVVLSLALPSLLAVVLYHGRLVDVQRESSLARAALREKLEREATGQEAEES